MASLNKVLLIGNLTRDPDVRMMSNGRPVCNFGLALNRSYKDSEGNRKEEVTFVDVECYGPRAEAVGKFLLREEQFSLRDALNSISGSLKRVKRSAIRVVLDNFEFVDSKQDNTPSQQYTSQPTSSNIQSDSSSISKSSDSAEQTSSDLDEDVPF